MTIGISDEGTPERLGVRTLLSQIGWAADHGIYFLALAGALMIPDICGALEAPDGQATGSRYAAWFDTHVAPLHNNWMTGDMCWKFRCSLLHQGTAQHPRGAYSRILFVEPGAHGGTFHMNVLNDALNIDARMFCLELVAAALAWEESVSGTEPYETNVRKFVTRYPNGLRPYIVGVPIIS